jgi:hypothetical protein
MYYIAEKSLYTFNFPRNTRKETGESAHKYV